MYELWLIFNEHLTISYFIDAWSTTESNTHDMVILYEMVLLNKIQLFASSLGMCITYTLREIMNIVAFVVIAIHKVFVYKKKTLFFSLSLSFC